jgi:hypothetical protein
MKKNRIGNCLAVLFLIAVVGFIWFGVGAVEIPQNVLLGQQMTSRQDYEVVWPVGHHYDLMLGCRTNSKDLGFTGTISIAHGGVKFFEKSMGSEGIVPVTCPQRPGEVDLHAGEHYTIMIELTQPRDVDGLELRLRGLKDYRDVRRGR